ncbi:MAG: metalloregulator ArsR/SmtB family transcription factor [Kiritimatiellae bacterium]|nr:metalloregulator ArsR/SmtB family transcription factor [Kiritimatiellia bacterium]
MNEIYLARARIMKALASPVRLMMVEALGREERCLCELQPLFRGNKSTLSRHIAALRNVGIIRQRREGTRIYLSLATPCILRVFDCVLGVLRAEAKRHRQLAAGHRGASRERREKGRSFVQPTVSRLTYRKVMGDTHRQTGRSSTSTRAARSRKLNAGFVKHSVGR